MTTGFSPASSVFSPDTNLKTTTRRRFCPLSRPPWMILRHCSIEFILKCFKISNQKIKLTTDKSYKTWCRSSTSKSWSRTVPSLAMFKKLTTFPRTPLFSMVHCSQTSSINQIRNNPSSASSRTNSCRIQTCLWVFCRNIHRTTFIKASFSRTFKTQAGMAKKWINNMS